MLLLVDVPSLTLVHPESPLNCYSRQQQAAPLPYGVKQQQRPQLKKPVVLLLRLLQQPQRPQEQHKLQQEEAEASTRQQLQQQLHLTKGAIPVAAGGETIPGSR